MQVDLDNPLNFSLVKPDIYNEDEGCLLSFTLITLGPSNVRGAINIIFSSFQKILVESKQKRQFMHLCINYGILFFST